MKNNANEQNTKKTIDLTTEEDLEKAAGGIHRMPPLPGTRRHRMMDPVLTDEKPKDGGATGGW